MLQAAQEHLYVAANNDAFDAAQQVNTDHQQARLVLEQRSDMRAQAIAALSGLRFQWSIFARAPSPQVSLRRKPALAFLLMKCV